MAIEREQTRRGSYQIYVIYLISRLHGPALCSQVDAVTPRYFVFWSVVNVGEGSGRWAMMGRRLSLRRMVLAAKQSVESRKAAMPGKDLQARADVALSGCASSVVDLWSTCMESVGSVCGPRPIPLFGTEYIVLVNMSLLALVRWYPAARAPGFYRGVAPFCAVDPISVGWLGIDG